MKNIDEKTKALVRNCYKSSISKGINKSRCLDIAARLLINNRKDLSLSECSVITRDLIEDTFNDNAISNHSCSCSFNCDDCPSKTVKE